MLKPVFSAVTLLTRLPFVSSLGGPSLKKVSRFFPLAGFLVGILLVCVYYFSYYLSSDVSVSTVLVLITSVLIAGAYHLDGLADTLDGFYAGRTSEDRLKIMRDSHIGAMGAIAVMLLLLAKYVFISHVPPENYNISKMLLTAPLIGRFNLTFLLGVFPYARHPATCVAGELSAETNKNDIIIAGIITLIPGFVFAGADFLYIWLAGLIFAYGFGKYSVKKINGITGDTLGAACELTEALVLLLWVIM